MEIDHIASAGYDCRRCLVASASDHLSHPPDGTTTYRICRMERCPNSVISYKLMLHLKKLKKVQYKKKSRVATAHALPSTYIKVMHFDAALSVPNQLSNFGSL
jgi:hypothetical protein